MSAQRREIEINTAARRRERAAEFRQHLINASNELYLHEMLCLQHGLPFPASLRRAHGAIRAELKRLERARQPEGPVDPAEPAPPPSQGVAAAAAASRSRVAGRRG